MLYIKSITDESVEALSQKSKDTYYKLVFMAMEQRITNIEEKQTILETKLDAAP